MATVPADIREIRRTVYGRDMRYPITDALQHINPDQIYRSLNAEWIKGWLIDLIATAAPWTYARAELIKDDLYRIRLT